MTIMQAFADDVERRLRALRTPREGVRDIILAAYSQALDALPWWKRMYVEYKLARKQI